MSLALTNPVIADFEFQCAKGGTPVPHTLCALELNTGVVHRYGPGELAQLSGPPFPSNHTLLAFAADAELSCYLALGWELPAQVVDLRIEHMMLDLNTTTVVHLGASLEGALAFYGMSHAVVNKKEMQMKAAQGPPTTPDDVEAMKSYCYEDVVATEKLYAVIAPKLDESCLYRGRYMKAVARIDARGIPFDVESFELIKNHRSELLAMWIDKLDPQHEIYDEKRTFRMVRFTEFLRKRGLLEAWPKTDKLKAPSRDADELRDFAAANPQNKEVVRLIELFATANLLKNFKLHVGPDGMNRVGFFNPFGTKTSRNAQNGYVFMTAKWLRSLMRPRPGMALAYLDWMSMEVGVAAHLSSDAKLTEAYLSGDAHMTLAKQGGMVPADASKDASKSPYACGPKCGKSACQKLPRCEEYAAHCDIRAQYKVCNLAALYFAIVQTLMDKGLSKEQAARTLHHHHTVYTIFWSWIEDQIESALISGEAQTADGWRIGVDGEAKRFNPRSVGNFFVQANSAAIMRLAAILAVERGLGICAVVHDAFLIEAPIADMQRQVTELRLCMDEASATILDGFVLGVDGWEESKWVVYPHRYIDERGADFWAEVEEALAKLKGNPDVVQSADARTLCEVQV